MLIRNVRKGLVPWRKVIRLAAIPLAMTVVGLALSASNTIYRQYQTSMPLETWQVVIYTSLGIGALFAAAFYGGATGFLLSVYPESVAAFQAERRRVLAGDAAAALLAAIGLWVFWRHVGAGLTDRFHAQAILGISDPSLIGNPAPALAAVASAVGSVFVSGALLAGLGLLAGMLRKRWMIVPLVLLLAGVGLSGEIRTPGELALSYGVTLLGVICAWVFCRWFARDNYLAYAVVLWAMGLTAALRELFGNPNAGLHLQGWMVAGALAASVVWMAWPALGRRESQMHS
jgi:hypothetical protein